MPETPRIPVIDAVVIGRNEGARLRACLQSLKGGVRRLVYVDSGSTDGSVQAARALGAEVVALDLNQPFTAARARNAGLASLAADPPDFVQLLDGDCQMQPEWLARALAAFADHPAAVVICGRRRERFPEASVWNRLADREWNTPVGSARACGGDALMRFADVRAVGGYRDDLIAGEEPELCLRLIRRGGQVWRIDAEMTLHDAALTRMSQWWRRSRRAGHAFAEGAALHGAGPERHWRAETRRALLWGGVLPVVILVGGLIHPAGFLLALIYPAQMLRLSRHEGLAWAFWMTLAKFAEAQGALGYWLDRLRGRRRGLIEYK
ncbi:glycosyltransferase [Fuscibacter oryzae]|uniref:Glycosyltransferase family 2 protein n=1 Tax=Fuscibacter oryzae TaxID=2803939 RepID=A0A8J7MNN8_9RHOB|nr:glycosyltransferase family 2 protein [Fuscibacter oryzae]MBL4928215.1 glycosyltransferase family 2 protein [Fuscibacter oryzae]